MIQLKRYTVALALGAMSSAAPAVGQELPSATSLIERYVQEIGGREAAIASFSSRAEGRFSVPSAGLTGELQMITAAPNKLLMVIDVAGLGTMRTGFDGNVGWSIDPIQGARLLSGGELREVQDQANPLYTVRDASLLTSAETVDRTEIGGSACYRVKLVWRSGRESFDCYAVDTGLLVATTATTESPLGAIEATTTMADYQQIGGVRMPTRITTEVMGMQQAMTFTSVEIGEVEAEVFELPAEIRALVSQGG